MSYKPGVAGSFSGFSLKPLSFAFGSFRYKTNTNLDQPCGTGLYPGKSQKVFFGVGDKPMSCKPGVAGSIPGFSIKPTSVSPWVIPL